MYIQELKSPIPMNTPRGSAYAYFLVDYHLDHHFYWICFLNDTGECWTFANPDIRIQNNSTINRNVK